MGYCLCLLSVGLKDKCLISVDLTLSVKSQGETQLLPKLLLFLLESAFPMCTTEGGTEIG